MLAELLGNEVVVVVVGGNIEFSDVGLMVMCIQGFAFVLLLRCEVVDVKKRGCVFGILISKLLGRSEESIMEVVVFDHICWLIVLPTLLLEDCPPPVFELLAMDDGKIFVIVNDDGMETLLGPNKFGG